MTEVAKTNNELSTEVEAWGAGEEISPEDIILSKLWIMQGQSKFVTKRRAALGDIVDSQTAEKMGDENTPIKALVFDRQDYWEVSKPIPGKTQEEWVKNVPIDNDNRTMPFEDAEGLHWRRTYNFFCIILKEDNTPLDFPFVITMRKTSLSVARKLIMKFGEWRNENRPSVNHVILFTSAAQTKGENDYWIWAFEIGEKCSKENEQVAKEWYVGLRNSASKFKVDNSDVEEGESSNEGSSAGPESASADDSDFL